MNKAKLAGFLIFVVIVVYAGKQFLVPPIMDIQSSISSVQTAKENRERAEQKLKSIKKRQQQEIEKKKLAEKIRKENEGNLKQIYVPAFTKEKDTTSLFGKQVKDIVTLAKKSGLRMHSWEFYTELKNEALLSGTSYSISETLDEEEEKQEETSKTNNTKYRGYQVDLGLLGSYLELKQFLTLIENYDYLIKIKKVESLPFEENPKILISNVSLVLYANTEKTN